MNVGCLIGSRVCVIDIMRTSLEPLLETLLLLLAVHELLVLLVLMMEHLLGMLLHLKWNTKGNFTMERAELLEYVHFADGSVDCSVGHVVVLHAAELRAVGHAAGRRAAGRRAAHAVASAALAGGCRCCGIRWWP